MSEDHCNWQAGVNFLTRTTTNYNLRGDRIIIIMPKVNTTNYGLKTWRYFAAKNRILIFIYLFID